MKSIPDILAEKLAHVYRKVSNIVIDTAGTRTKIFRIAVGEADLMGDYSETIDSQIIDNVTITYPSGELEINSNMGVEQTDSTDFDMWDIMPIMLKVPFQYDNDLDFDTSAIAITTDDIIVHVKYDENRNKIPIIMEVKKVKSEFLHTELVNKFYELTLHRGTLSTELQVAIDLYVTNI